MNHKIQYKNFLKTFNDEQLESIRQFNEVISLHKKGYSRQRILQKIEVSLDKLHQWRNTSIKPIPIKIIETAKERGYFEPIQEEQLEEIAYLIGFNLGDGNISRNLCNTWFYGVSSDLESIKHLFNKYKVKPVVYTYKINNGKMAIHDHVFSRFLVVMGAVSGDKTKTKFNVPEWIKNSKKASKIKKRFLQGFFDSELSDLKLEKNRVFAYKVLKLYSVKEKKLIREGTIFLDEIRNILKEFKVQSSKVSLDRDYTRKRDRNEMQQIFFSVNSNYINLYNFVKNVGFLYNSKRKKHALESFDQIKNKAGIELEKIKKYEKAINLSKKGLSAYKIAKKLNIQDYHIKNWIYFQRKPRLYNFIKTKLN